MKKSLVVLMILAMVLSIFASCNLAALAEEEVETIRYVVPGNNMEKEDEVYAAINEKMKADGLNLKLEVTRIPWDAWDQKTQLMVASGEEFDLIEVMQDLKTVGVLYGQGMLTPLNEYLEKEEFSFLKNLFSDAVWSETSLGDGTILAVPAITTANEGKVYGDVNYRSDIAEKLGLEIPTTPEEVVEFTAALQQYFIDTEGITAYAYSTRRDPFDWIIRGMDQDYFDINEMGLAGVRQDGTVFSWVESEEFKYCCDIMHQFYERGLIDPDVLAQDAPMVAENDEIEHGYFTVCFDTAEPRMLPDMRKNNPDINVGTILLNPDKGDFIDSFSWNCNGIPVTSKNPEKALRFLSWLYSSKENHDLFMYGIEGETYSASDDLHYESFIGDDGSPLYNHGEWMIAYLPLRRFAEGIPNDVVELMRRDRMNDPTATYGAALGFSFDASQIQEIVANLDAECDRVLNPMKYGVVTYEDGIDAALADLNAAGLQEYIAEYQRQLTAYLEAKTW